MNTADTRRSRATRTQTDANTRLDVPERHKRNASLISERDEYVARESFKEHSKTKIVKAAKNDVDLTTYSDDDSSDEYEYVPLSEATSGTLAKLRDIWVDHSFVISIAIFVLFSMLLLAIGKTFSAAFIGIAFALLVIFFSAILYTAWQEKKQAEIMYKRAEAVLNAVKKTQHDIGDDNVRAN